jgi:hypothetical protein
VIVRYVSATGDGGGGGGGDHFEGTMVMMIYDVY